MITINHAFGHQARRWGLAIALLVSASSRASQYLEVISEIEINDWSSWFHSDQSGMPPGLPKAPGIFDHRQTRRCVVGDGRWMIQSILPTSTVTRWFTGTQVVEHTVITGKAEPPIPKDRASPILLALEPAPVGAQFTRLYPSTDGNPGRPVRVADLMGTDLPATVSWLAFASGPVLRREGRQMYPPSAFWKQSSLAFAGWTESTEVFQDGLGLPRSLQLISTNRQVVFEYQVRRSTNLLGWNIPMEFYGVQYLPVDSNQWRLHLTFKGRVTSVGPSQKPEIPAEVMRSVAP